MLAAAVCPHPPGLHPQVGLGLPEMEAVRSAARESVNALVKVGPSRIVVLAPGSGPEHNESAGGTFDGFGCDVRCGGQQLDLAAPHSVGAWLLDDARWRGPRTYVNSLAELDGRDCVLVMADGDTAAGVSTPTHGDARALAMHEEVSAALHAGDAMALARLDAVAAAQWDGTGIAPLQQLGAAARGSAIEPTLRYDGEPFGVRYWVALWSLV